MRLDASTAEIAQFLQKQGYRVNHPVEAEIDDGQARITLEGNRHVIVTRASSGLHAEYERTTPPDRESNRINAMEHERLTKAHQTAQLLLADVREVHAKADSVAMDELMIGVVAQVANITRLLKRLSEEA